MTKCSVMLSFAVLWVTLVNAQQVVPKVKNGIPAEKPTAESRSNFLAHAGGFLMVPASGPNIAIVNCQSRLQKDVLAETVEVMKRNTRLPYLITEKKGKDGVAVANEILASTNIAVAIVLVEAKNQPPLLIAPEARWAVVNVSALDGKGVSQEVYTSRVKKELWRALGYVMGAANSNYSSCVLKPVFKSEDLDNIKIETTCPEPVGKMLQQAGLLGIKPTTYTTYRKACEEGWAPMPTNALQKAVWEEVKGTKK